MCHQKRYVNNRYIGKSVLVNCGKCEECLQEKANLRAMRIRNHTQSDNGLCLFLTLTYDNRFVPYIKVDDLQYARDSHLNSEGMSHPQIPVYRDYNIRFYKGQKFVTSSVEPIYYVSFEHLDECDYIPQLNKKSGCFGVVYYDDVKNFFKRLRINLKRGLGYEEKITYYAVSEYGGKSSRPHFHALVYFPKGDIEKIRPYIVKSWPYGDMCRSGKRIQVARDCASYVSSYVTKSVGLPKICSENIIRQKFSHSRYFGHNLREFTLPSLLEKVDNGDLCYHRQIITDGVADVVSLPVPKYIINRFFPRFKGDSLFSCSEVRRILRQPSYLWDKLGKRGFWDGLTSYTKEEYSRFVSHLSKCILYYKEVTGKTEIDYVIDYERIWTARRCWVLNHQYDNIRDFGAFYFNINEFLVNPDIAPTLSRYREYYYNYNNYPSDLAKDKTLKDLYYKKQNERYLTGLMLSEIYDDM